MKLVAIQPTKYLVDCIFDNVILTTCSKTGLIVDREHLTVTLHIYFDQLVYGVNEA